MKSLGNPSSLNNQREVDRRIARARLFLRRQSVGRNDDNFGELKAPTRELQFDQIATRKILNVLVNNAYLYARNGRTLDFRNCDMAIASLSESAGIELTQKQEQLRGRATKFAHLHNYKAQTISHASQGISYLRYGAGPYAGKRQELLQALSRDLETLVKLVKNGLILLPDEVRVFAELKRSLRK